MPDQMNVLAPEPIEHLFEVDIEGADLSIAWEVRVAMSAEVESKDRSVFRERGRQMVPPVCVRSAAVKQNCWRCVDSVVVHFGRRGIDCARPVQAVEFYSVVGCEVPRF